MIKVNGEPLAHRPGMTVAEVLKAKNFIFPMLIVKIDERLITRDAWATTPVRDGATVDVIHLISGG